MERGDDMVNKVIIRDNTKAPIRYLPELKAFKNGKTFAFKDGVNVIVGENGSGKTTLMNLIRHYLLVDYTECSRGKFNCNINSLYRLVGDGFCDGVDVYADYKRNTFRLCHHGEKVGEDILDSFASLGQHLDEVSSSTGEGVLVATNYLFRYIFSKEVKLTFDYEQFNEGNRPEYAEYIKAHRQEGASEWTILMDEPDRNLDIENIGQIKGILSFHKPATQIIAVVHNPLLIVALSRMSNVNIIEMTKGYVKRVTNMVNDLFQN